MNILVISPNAHHLSVGGVERYIKNFIDYCADQEGSFYFLLPAKGKDQVVRKKNTTIIYSNSMVLTQKMRTGNRSALVSKKVIKRKSQDFFQILSELIDQKDVSAVIAQNFHVGLPPSYSLLLNMVCHAKNVPAFMQLHSYASSEIQTELINSLFWQKIICVSKSVAGDTFQKGANIKSLTTKYLGVNTEEFSTDINTKWLKKKLKLPATSKIVLSASRILHGYRDILKEKGFTNLLDAFSKIAHRDESLHLVLAIGKPPTNLNSFFEEALKKLEGFIQIHGLDDRVTVKTFKLEEMPKVYAGSDVFVLASENETFGQVYLEAMACGLPVIGTKVGGVPEIISDGYNGFLTIPNDSSQLSQKIMELIRDTDLRQSFITNGLKTINRKFDSKKLFKKLLDYLEKTS